ncbi:MAG: sigma-E factor negative regulatory protein [Thiotrichaceae bacterium]
MNKNTTDTTTTTQTEYLSAFLDDESEKFEQRRMLDEVQKDDGLQQKVANFSLIGEAMRNEKSCVTVQPNFLMGIHDKLEAEPAYTKVYVKKAANQSSWLQPVKGLALAASLAAVAIIAINLNKEQVPVTDMMVQQTTDLTESTAQATDLAKVTTVDGYKPVAADGSSADGSNIKKALLSANTFHAPDTAWRNRLKRYVNSHTKYASTSAIMPSVRAVSYASSY